MMLEFESLPTVRTLEPPDDCGLLVAQQVALQTIHIENRDWSSSKYWPLSGSYHSDKCKGSFYIDNSTVLERISFYL